MGMSEDIDTYTENHSETLYSSHVGWLEIALINRVSRGRWNEPGDGLTTATRY